MSEYPGQGTPFGDFIERVNRRLRPYLNGAQLGPPDEAPLIPPARGGSCPVCGRPMDEHTLDRSGERTQLYCPEIPARTSAP